MLASYRWLKELVPGLEATPVDLAERLTRAGLELEEQIEFGAGLESVLVARVQKLEPHPNPKRDKLRLVTVTLGDEEQTIVCGASNVPDPGGLVALARVGTHLPAIGITLDKRAIGGVDSEGMLCSESEMGLADESDGIFVLEPNSAEPGTPLSEALPECRDTIFDLGVTPNRPDALSHVGLAREVAALYGLKVEFPPAADPERTSTLSLGEQIAIDNLDTERCPHYGARVTVDVTIADSPSWLRWRLQSLGVRPISNVVDITNLLLLEFGQPMHAFDLDRVRKNRIVVRRAKVGEPLRTLDGEDRSLTADDLVICDGEGPVALAGVMGGANSEIQPSTRRVLLECAYFEPRGVRRTSRRHGLSSESSFRFERGVDWARVPDVLDRATALLTALAGGSALEGAIHAAGHKPDIPVITLRSARLNALLGLEIPFDEACTTLGRLGLEVDRQGGVATVTGASFRPDLSLEVDLIEEVARLRGLDDIPAILPAIAPQPPRTTGLLERRVKQVAVELGLSEAIPYSFVSPDELARVSAPEAAVTLLNPLTEERSVMRTSLLPGMLEALKRARRRGERSVRLFSVGSVFLKTRPDEPGHAAELARPTGPTDSSCLPYEQPAFCAVLAGPRDEYLSAHPEDLDVYDLLGLATELTERLSNRTAKVSPADGASEATHLHPRGAGLVFVGEIQVGRIGPLHPDVIEAFDLDGSALVFELDLSQLEAAGRASPRFKPIPRLPAVTRDIALVVPETVPAGDVGAHLQETAGGLCESVSLFDLFTGGSVPAGHRSLAFRVVYRDPLSATDPDNARTLTDKEVDKQHKRVVQAAEARFGAQLRT